MGRSRQLREFRPKSDCSVEYWVAGAVIGGAIIGGVSSYEGASKQASASEQATNVQQQMFNQQVGDEAPFMTAGANAIAGLDYQLGIGPDSGGTGYGALNKPFTTADWKSLSPAYNMQLQQGMQGTLGQSASSQGALSGAALSSLQANNQGLANTSFNNAFNMYQTQNQNVYSRLAGIANLGEAAASNQATGGSNYAQGIGQSITNTGTAIGGGIAGAGNSVANAGLLGALYQGGTLGNPNSGGTNFGVTDPSSWEDQ